MAYAHVTAGTIDAIGQPPDVVFYGGRWYDLRTRDPDTLATVGWLPVTETPRPADTATTTHDYSVTLVAGVPTETWTPRPWTQAELNARAAEANRQQLEADTGADLTKLSDAIAALALLLGDATTVGSIRAWKAPITNTANLTGAQGKALADLLIQAVQSNRKVARQTLRLAKAMVGDYTSADVGTE